MQAMKHTDHQDPLSAMCASLLDQASIELLWPLNWLKLRWEWTDVENQRQASRISCTNCQLCLTILKHASHQPPLYLAGLQHP